jgi:hypothetical protein
MTAVLTTHAKALTSATPGDFVSGAGDVPVFLVTMRGNFVPTAASRPPGAPAPAGSYLSIVVDARTFQVLDSGISPSPPPVSPASLGPVTYLAGQCQEILTELDLPLDVAMTFTCYAFAAEQSIACGGIGEQARAVKGQAVAASAAGAGERAKDPYQQAALLFCYYLRFVVVVVSNIISPISQVSRHQSACLRIDHRVCRLALGACLVACARPWVPGGCKQKECQP